MALAVLAGLNLIAGWPADRAGPMLPQQRPELMAEVIARAAA